MSVRFQSIAPPPQLRPYIRAFWTLESDTENYIHRSMADVCPELLFHYKCRFEELKPGGGSANTFYAGVRGQSVSINRFLAKERFGIFGIYLYPFALSVLFNVPAIECTDQMPSLEELLNAEGSILEERMLFANNNEQRLKIISAFFSKKLRQNQKGEPGVFSSIQHILQTRGREKIARVASRYFLSNRQFERQFKEHAGFTPKRFSRITRFNATLKEFGNTEKSLTDIAHVSGYYDQSHFIHDFKAFSGHHPKHFFSGKAEGTEWMK